MLLFLQRFRLFFFDYYRNKFLEIVYVKISSVEDQITEFTEEKKRILEHPEDAGLLDNFLITIYIAYSKLQLKLQKNKDINELIPNPKVYFLQNKTLLRLWSFIGSTTHITLCIVCALMNNLELFLLFCILPLNFLLLVLYLVQRKVNSTIEIN